MQTYETNNVKDSKIFVKTLRSHREIIFMGTNVDFDEIGSHQMEMFFYKIYTKNLKNKKQIENEEKADRQQNVILIGDYLLPLCPLFKFQPTISLISTISRSSALSTPHHPPWATLLFPNLNDYLQIRAIRRRYDEFMYDRFNKVAV